MPSFESHFDERVLDRNRTILVTGGTGYLGKHLVKALLKRGFILNVLVRDTSDMTGLEGCNFFQGDLTDPASLRHPLENATYAVHLAARTPAWGVAEGEFQRVNVEGYENLLRACQEAGVRKVLQTCSYLAFGPSNGQVHTEESTRSLPPLDPFEQSMCDAVAVSRRYLERGMLITTLYPTMMFGPGELKPWNPTARLIRLLRGGRVHGLIEGGMQQWNFVHVDDVVAGHMVALRRTHPDAYILGGENLLVRDFLAIAAKAMRKRAPKLKVSLRIARFSASVDEMRARWARREPLLSRHIVETLSRSWALSSHKAEQELNYKPRPLEPAITGFVEWLQQNDH